jgi:hypothetical protein
MNATETRSTDMTVANTIFAQLGGPRFSAMTGCKNLMGDSTSLTFAIGRGAKDGINRVRVTLDLGSDTYTVAFFKIGRAPSFKVAVVAEIEGVYCDDLRRVFTNHTGFYTSF